MNIYADRICIKILEYVIARGVSFCFPLGLHFCEGYFGAWGRLKFVFFVFISGQHPSGHLAFPPLISLVTSCETLGNWVNSKTQDKRHATSVRRWDHLRFFSRHHGHFEPNLELPYQGSREAACYLSGAVLQGAGLDHWQWRIGRYDTLILDKLKLYKSEVDARFLTDWAAVSLLRHICLQPYRSGSHKRLDIDAVTAYGRKYWTTLSFLLFVVFI